MSMRINIYSFGNLPIFTKMAHFNNTLGELAKAKEEFFDNLNPNQIPELWFSPNANLMGSQGRLKLNAVHPVSVLDPKASATLAQQFIDQTDFISEILSVAELPPDLSILSIKANVLHSNTFQISTLSPLSIKHLIKFFTKKSPFVRRRGRRRKFNVLYIKRYRFITSTELLKFFLFRTEQTQTDQLLPNSNWKEFLAYIKSLRLFIVDISGRKRS